MREEIHEKILLSFAEDLASTKIWGWTKGGIFELERERDKVPLDLLLQDF